MCSSLFARLFCPNLPLSLLSPHFSFLGLGINDADQIVGASTGADFSILRGYGNLVDLNRLITGGNSLSVMTACPINSRGEIVGIAIDPNAGETDGYLATPTPWGLGKQVDCRQTLSFARVG